jgi:hypothetical protein
VKARLFVLLLTVLSPAVCARSEDDERVAIDRCLVNLCLGDTLEEIQRIYPPAQEWPVTTEKRAKVKRYRVERAFTKYPAPHADILWLGLKHGRLAEIQLVYTAAYTRKKSVDALASDLSLTYGQPRASAGKYWWVDGKTVIRTFAAEMPSTEDGASGVELRTSLQLLEAALFPKGESRGIP